jgi:tRNA pseudouridine55 synthase
LYRSARRGAPVAAPPARVRVDRIDLKQLFLPDVDLEITCGSGTYIRAIARDIGADLGFGAHLVTLRRTSIGAFRADTACTIEDLARPERVAETSVSPVRALEHIPAIRIDGEAVEALRHGRMIAAPAGTSNGTAALVHDDILLAMGEVAEGWIRPRKVFAG